MVESKQTPEYKGRGIFNSPTADMKEVIFAGIQKFGPITRNELMKELGIPRTTLYDNIVKLMINKKIQKFSVGNKKRGRPKVYYKIIL